MANLIDKDYFVRDINIPDNGISGNTTLTDVITRYEPEYLKKVLGYTLWKEFTDALEVGSPAQKWVDLQEGKEFSFEYNGRTVSTKWEGFTNDSKVTPIAYYCYYKHRKDVELINSGLGQRKNKGENSKSASALKMMTDAWNNCVDLSGKQSRTFKRYPDRFLSTDNYAHITPDPSLFNFLLANLTDYSNWIFSPLWKINTFGI